MFIHPHYSQQGTIRPVVVKPAFMLLVFLHKILGKVSLGISYFPTSIDSLVVKSLKELRTHVIFVCVQLMPLILKPIHEIQNNPRTVLHLYWHPPISFPVYTCNLYTQPFVASHKVKTFIPHYEPLLHHTR